MKKSQKILAFFLGAALFCFGCQNSTGGDSGGSSGGSQGSGGTESSEENSVPNADVGDFEIGSTSVQMAQNMAIGWNLGNTLDATVEYTDGNGTYHTSSNAGISTETNWGMPKTTKAMITAVKNAGFKTIRIPVSWHNHLTDTTNYTIDSAWMARVKEVVDYAYSQNMCVILNIHHDNIAISKFSQTYGFSLSDDSTIQTKSKSYIEKVWTQIATTFASYDNHLVFEILNEPRDIGGEFASAKGYSNSNEWGTDQKTTMDIITAYEQVGINAIRAVSGNENRYIMVPGYAASGSDNSMLAIYTMPTDTASDKLLLSSHAYSPYLFAMSDPATPDTTFDSSDKSSLDSMFSYLKTNYTDKGIGVVMGEASASDKNNLSDREAWMTYYVTKALNAKIPVVLWDNMVTVSNGGDISSGECHGYLNRNSLEWYFPTLITNAMKAVYGSDYTTSDGSTDDEGGGNNSSDTTETELLSASLDLTSWSENTTIAASAFASAASSSTLTFTVEAWSSSEAAAYYSIKLQDQWGDSATIICSGTASGATISSGTFSPTAVPGTFSYMPTSAEWTAIKANGLIVYGYGVKITSIILK